MSVGTQKLITAEEFARMPDPPDGSQQELVRGVIVTMPPPKAFHGVCCAKIVRRLGNFVDEHALGTICCNDTGFLMERDPDSVRRPDVSFWKRERLSKLPEEYIDIPPDLIVEVVSPGDHYSRVQNKVRHYLSRGVPLIWVVDPEDRSATVYRPGIQGPMLTEGDTLSGEEALPGFSCLVRDLFP
jgi:Uma2 family endonuclease